MIWIAWYLRELVFPSTCASCGAEGGEIICPRCLREMPGLPRPACPLCASPTLYPVEACRRCRRRRPGFDRAVALGLYQGSLRDMVLELKYRNGRRLAPLLGAMLAAEAGRELGGEEAEAVTFVPMHRARERKRGYNQAGLLAREVSRHLGLPLLAPLVRTRDTPPQAGLSHRERLANLKGCFAVKEGAEVPGSLLLVDDVLTTGATLSGCASSLKRAGAERVVVLVAARDLPSAPAAQPAGERRVPGRRGPDGRGKAWG